MNRPATLGMALLLALLLSACGWQLRGVGGGAAGLDGTAVYVAGSPARALQDAVDEGLSVSGARQVDSAEAADLVLRIVGDARERRTLTVDRDIRAREYELRYRLTFELDNADGEHLLARSQVNAVRGFRADRDDPVGTEGREEELLIDLRRDAVRLMLLQVAAHRDAEPITDDNAAAAD
ncbi:LPS assembly lipoprotein LptE [Alkalilimnicola ehrlichii MLHE-1]|uniref:LPS-assembly lipoprotein LptE n=1 Tax=Alkalilimnicola ehrlichii (strain ATCC BAA-1101 / DSM 17681 / MLHE-1) TaxID=187272 RepID=Q0ABN2_ALKEH|nr:LPS assembly lipoprotein LptE [Alkalilimnicola ehrlichii]ABI55755.1 Rare lipoprotein B-like protein [Alkalilimnicola ehrlichii MLHE-1]